MRIWPVSDLHEEFAKWAPPDVVPDHDVVVVAGDLITRMRRGPARLHDMGLDERPVVYVGGNHEFYGETRDRELEKAREAARAYPNIHILQDEEVVIHGTRFLGATLWSDYRLFGDDRQKESMALAGNKIGGMNDFQRIRMASKDYGRFRPEDAVVEHARTVAWLRARLEVAFDGPTVVVTHHAPSARSLPDDFAEDPLSTAYASNLDDLVEASGASLWLHGHIHEARDYSIGDTRVVSNPRGYVESVRHGRRVEVRAQDTGFDPGLVVEVGPQPRPEYQP